MGLVLVKKLYNQCKVIRVTKKLSQSLCEIFTLGGTYQTSRSQLTQNTSEFHSMVLFTGLLVMKFLRAPS